MAVTTRIPTPLRKLTGGLDAVQVAAGTIGDVIDALEAKNPGIRERIVNEDGKLHRFVNIYVNGEDIRFTSGLNTAVKDGDEVSIVPAVAGGR